jgi:hypothetical protein
VGGEREPPPQKNIVAADPLRVRPGRLPAFYVARHHLIVHRQNGCDLPVIQQGRPAEHFMVFHDTFQVPPVEDPFNVPPHAELEI